MGTYRHAQYSEVSLPLRGCLCMEIDLVLIVTMESALCTIDVLNPEVSVTEVPLCEATLSMQWNGRR